MRPGTARWGWSGVSWWGWMDLIEAAVRRARLGAVGSLEELVEDVSLAALLDDLLALPVVSDWRGRRARRPNEGRAFVVRMWRASGRRAEARRRRAAVADAS